MQHQQIVATRLPCPAVDQQVLRTPQTHVVDPVVMQYLKETRLF